MNKARLLYKYSTFVSLSAAVQSVGHGLPPTPPMRKRWLPYRTPYQTMSMTRYFTFFLIGLIAPKFNLMGQAHKCEIEVFQLRFLNQETQSEKMSDSLLATAILTST